AGVLPVWPGLVHLVALPPLDLFGDLRVLLTTTTGPVSFTLLLALVLAVRVTILALMTGGLTRERLALAAAFYGVLLIPTLFAAEAVYIAGTLLYARLFWAGLVAVAVLSLVFAPLPWRTGPRIRDTLAQAWRDGFRVGVTLPYGFAVVGVGALADLFPGLTLALVPVSATAPAVAVTALARPARPGGPIRLGAVAVAFALLAWAWVATRGTEPPEPDRPARPRAGSVLVMSGIDSRSGAGTAFRTRTDLLGYGCDQTFYFSYAGPGDGQPRGEALCPIRTGAPYVSAHTQRPVDEQLRAFAEQTEDLPRPLVVVGHSQGAWIAWKAVATGAAPRVDALILVGPFPESTGGYRPTGEPGPGRPASDLLQVLTPLSRTADFTFDPGSPAGYALLGTTDAPASILSLPLPEHTRSLSVV
ncbi:alpha/beta fold hydrolase, partial [Nocardiopsis lucentensis]|uniref:alpha/beta hydrolase n=1 Tax=Nocardiopsis lucentensis TaxID=53441 RepID=UPI00038147B9